MGDFSSDVSPTENMMHKTINSFANLSSTVQNKSGRKDLNYAKTSLRDC